MSQTVKADQIPISLKPNTPYGLHLDDKQIKNLSSYIETCKVTEKNLGSTRKAFETCRDTHGLELQFWQKPWGAVSIGLGAFILGMVVEKGIR